MTYLCGHQASFEHSKLFSGDSDYAARAFPCPSCCRATALQAGAQVFVNMQKLSDEMSAIVLEVTDAYPLLERLLERDGYSHHGRSLDEFNPGQLISGSAEDQAWRKEYWFASNTEPGHVVALIGLVKEEVSWLEEYLPHPGSVHYLDFPPQD